VVAIVARAAFTFGRSTIKRWWDGILAVLIAGYLVLGGNPVLAIFAGALIGLLVYSKTINFTSVDQHLEEQHTVSNNMQVLIIILVGAVLLTLLMLTNRRLFDLALLKLKVDVLAFGGGFASVPVMLHSVVEVNNWVDARTFMDGIAMGQITPGPIVITATFIGYQVAGILGSIVATIAVFFPSFVILVYVVPRFDRIKKNRYFQMAIKGILVSFVGLLQAITYRFAMVAPWSPASVVIGCLAFGALMLNVNIAWIVLPGAVLSALFLR
jgi:chromate transporter